MDQTGSGGVLVMAALTGAFSTKAIRNKEDES